MRFAILVIAASTLGFAAEPVTLTGLIGENMCAGDHKKMGGTYAMKCTEECVKGMGAKYSLIVGEKDNAKVYELADQTAAAKYIGKKVTVKGEVSTVTEGKMTTNTLKAQSIKPAN